MKTASLDEFMMMMKNYAQIAILIASLLIKVKNIDISEATRELELHHIVILTVIPIFITCLRRNVRECIVCTDELSLFAEDYVYAEQSPDRLFLADRCIPPPSSTSIAASFYLSFHCCVSMGFDRIRGY